MPEWILKMKKDFIVAFIEDNRWKYLVEGVSNTIILTFFALILGVVLGVVIAAIRTTYDKQYNEMRNPVAKFFLAIGNAVCKVYLTVIRGTPAMVQILIIFFIIIIQFSILTPSISCHTTKDAAKIRTDRSFFRNGAGNLCKEGFGSCGEHFLFDSVIVLHLYQKNRKQNLRCLLVQRNA